MNGPLRVGVGGPVGSGKTALMDALCKRLRGTFEIAAITNDIYTKWDAEYLVRSGALAPERIAGVETGGCPHTAIREDASINLAAVAEMRQKFPDLDLVLIESGGDNLAATFSPELADLTIYVIDVAAGDKIPSKGGPGITRSDLLVINKVDLAPHVGASLEVMERDAKKMRGARPFVFTNLKTGSGVDTVVELHPGQRRARRLMLTFTRHFRDKTDQVTVEPETLIVAGWTGRDEAALRHHIEELAAIGVPRPSSVPVFYRNGVNNIMQTERLEVLGPDTSGEVEPVVVALADGLWIGLGSDHTDRKAETMGIALSKQLCGKVMGPALWRFDEIAEHWDQIMIRSFATIGGERVLYQEGPLAAMRHPDDLIARYRRQGARAATPSCSAARSARRAASGRPSRFEMELDDPVLKRRMTHAYDVVDLPVIT